MRRPIRVKAHTKRRRGRRVLVRGYTKHVRKSIPVSVYKERTRLIQQKRQENISLGMEAQKIRDFAQRATIADLPLIERRVQDIRSQVARNNAVIDKTNDTYFPKNKR